FDRALSVPGPVGSDVCIGRGRRGSADWLPWHPLVEKGQFQSSHSLSPGLLSALADYVCGRNEHGGSCRIAHPGTRRPRVDVEVRVVQEDHQCSAMVVSPVISSGLLLAASLHGRSRLFPGARGWYRIAESGHSSPHGPSGVAGAGPRQGLFPSHSNRGSVLRGRTCDRTAWTCFGLALLLSPRGGVYTDRPERGG